MKKILISLIIILFAAGLGACNTTNSGEDGISTTVGATENTNNGEGISRNTSDPENDSQVAEGSEAGYYPNSREGFKSAYNEAFDFWFDLPEEWRAIDRSENGDGYFITTETKDVDIRVYGQLKESTDDEYLQKLSGKNGKIEDFVFNDGVKGKRVVNTTSRVYYVRADNDTYICLYVNYKENPSWYQSNTDKLTGIATSLRTRMEGPKLGDGINKITLEDLKLGEISISMPIQNVKKLMKSKLEGETKDDLGATILFYGDDTEIYIIDGEVYTMNITNNKYVTPRGLKTGDGKERVKELYGEPDNTEGDTHWGYTYDGYELFSVIFENDKVAQLQIDMVR